MVFFFFFFPPMLSHLYWFRPPTDRKDLRSPHLQLALADFGTASIAKHALPLPPVHPSAPGARRTHPDRAPLPVVPPSLPRRRQERLRQLVRVPRWRSDHPGRVHGVVHVVQRRPPLRARPRPQQHKLRRHGHCDRRDRAPGTGRSWRSPPSPPSCMHVPCRLTTWVNSRCAWDGGVAGLLSRS